jgi:maltooligosyltrehalose trehalohydrolase
VEVVLEGAGRFPLAPSPGGYHEGLVSGAGAGDRYRYLVDGAGPFPDPASRWQPDGIHGPSMVVDPGAYRWTDVGFPGLSLGGLTVYELHVGTFSEEGTFAGAAARLGRLADLGVGRSS